MSTISKKIFEKSSFGLYRVRNSLRSLWTSPLGEAPPPPLSHTHTHIGEVGERCSPKCSISFEVTKAQRAHRELCSLECSWGREVLSTPQDLPSTVYSATCDPLGQLRSAIGHMARAPLWGSVVGWRKPQVTPPTDSPSSLSVGLPCPGTGHTHPPPHTDKRTAAQWRQKVCNCALTECHEPPTCPERARHTHKHGGISLPPAPWWGSGNVNSLEGCETRQPG